MPMTPLAPEIERQLKTGAEFFITEGLLVPSGDFWEKETVVTLAGIPVWGDPPSGILDFRKGWYVVCEFPDGLQHRVGVHRLKSVDLIAQAALVA